MQVKTRDFGVIEVNEADVITFRQPIFGFEALKSYVMLLDDALNGEFAWLQSIEDESICFVLANPTKMVPDYCPAVTDEMKKLLDEGTYEFWLVMVVTEPFQNSTVNLKSPVVLNLKQNAAAQVILEDALPIRYQLFDAKREG